MNKKNIAAIALTVLCLTNTCTYSQDKEYDAICKKYGFSVQEELEMGFQSTISLIKQYGVFKDPTINQYVSSIGESIAQKISKRPLIKYRFIILNTYEVNAFAAPGGFIFITKGTLKLLDNEAELAGVLSHEISHVENGHGLASISADPKLKETIKSTKTVVDSGDGLSQQIIDLLDKELDYTNTGNNQSDKLIPVKNQEKMIKNLR